MHRAFSRFLLLGGILSSAFIVLFGKALKPEQLWSLQPVIRPTLPSVSSPLVSNPIDAFIIEKLEQKNLEPSPLAKDSIIVRRLYLDLHGLLPSPKEIKDYCENKDPKNTLN